MIYSLFCVWCALEGTSHRVNTPTWTERGGRELIGQDWFKKFFKLTPVSTSLFFFLHFSLSVIVFYYLLKANFNQIQNGTILSQYFRSKLIILNIIFAVGLSVLHCHSQWMILQCLWCLHHTILNPPPQHQVAIQTLTEGLVYFKKVDIFVKLALMQRIARSHVRAMLTCS